MSSFSVLWATNLSASSGSGRCNALASFYGAHPYVALFMGRQDDGHGFGWIGSTTALAMSLLIAILPTIVALMAAAAIRLKPLPSNNPLGSSVVRP